MASTVTELLRRRFGGKKGEETDLTGWTLGKGITSANYLVNDDTLCVSPYYDIQGGDIVEIKAFNVYNNSHQCKIMEFNGNTRVFQETMKTVPYSRTTASNATIFRCVCSLEVIDDCYIKINNVYIWKGKNI